MSTDAAETLPRQASPGRWRRLVLVGVLAPLAAGLFLVGLYLYRVHVEEQKLREAVAEADRLDPGWRLRDLLDARAAVPDDENSALVVASAVRLFPSPGTKPHGRKRDYSCAALSHDPKAVV